MIATKPSRRPLVLLVALSTTLFLASAASAQFGKNKVRYQPFDWHTYKSPHFTMYYYPETEDQLQRVVSMAESAYDQLSRELDFQIQEPTPFLIYATHSEFLQNNIILNFIPEGVAAFATPARFRMVMPIDLPDPELYALILHELTHIFQYHILFGGSLGRALTSSPPLWLMEGMASYFAKDETASDRMYLRDAVVNDTIPPITEANIGGFFAYRFGHAAFDFMEERWGSDGVLDFLFEFRNTLGARVGRAVERAFGVEAEDFDIEFRRWLRKKYLPELVATGEPSDFGRPFRTDESRSQETSPAASPSGDLVAAFSTHKQDLDVVLFDAERRRLLRNLTKGYSSKYQHLVGQHLTAGRGMGRDISFSPDGNQLAVFARRESGYSLVLINVLKGGVDRVIDMDVEQQTAPAWSPDGRHIAFSANHAGDFDIFLLDVDTLEITNLTYDDLFDGAPSFSSDGKSLIFSSVIGEHSQLFRISLDNPQERFRITDNEYNDTDPVLSPDDRRVFFTSDRTGAENIFGLDLETGELRQYTNAVTGCFMPTVLAQPTGEERLVYTGYWKGRFDLYESDLEEPIGDVVEVEIAEGPTSLEDLDRFQPDIEVSIDDAEKEDKRGFRLFLEDAQTFAGVDDDQTLIGQVVLQFSDFFGDRRLIALLQSVESFSNFNVTYANLSRRLQWTATVFDDRDFYISQNFFDGRIQRGRSAFTQTGAIFGINYPFSLYRRAELGAGFILRDIDFQSFVRAGDGSIVPIVTPREDEFPLIQGALVSDTTLFGPAGPTSGHRVRLSASYAPDTDESGTLSSSVSLEARKYFPLTRRSSFAVRLFGTVREGNFPNPVFFGGLDTVRGFDFRSLVGDHGFFTNMELRFPIIDLLATPVKGLAFQGIQARFFLDVAGAWFDDFEDFDLWNSDDSRLQDAVSSYGFGFTIRLFGLDLNWDFSKRWDFKDSGESATSFWIGQRF